MEAPAVTAVLVTVFGWCVLAVRLERVALTAPIVFVAAGLSFSGIGGLPKAAIDPEVVKVVAEVTLVWVLFADASRVRLSQLRHEAGTYVRLLGVGLPLTIALGALAAMVVLDLGVWPALLVGAALAPTDAALGATIMADPRVPATVRRVENVESGLNDGIVTPVVLLAVAGVAAEQGVAGVEAPGRATVSLLLGLAVGVVLGAAGGTVTRLARERRWLPDELDGPAVLSLALLSYTGALVVDGNGFVAAFVAGLAFGSVAGPSRTTEVLFVDQVAALASMVSWLVFGAVAVPLVVEEWSGLMVAYAVLSLTVVRMLPVALVLTGAGFDRFSVAFIGWFGPRGLASVVFALLTLESLHDAGRQLVAVIALTVLLSVLAHGLTARPLSTRFGEAAQPGVDRPGTGGRRFP
jgi:NhaP-type Na+/H+ or K+/H+ antiporter